MSKNNDEKLKIAMTQYKILRHEAMERLKLQLQIYPLALTAISLLFGYVIEKGKYDALLILPFITILLAYRWLWDVRLLDTKRKYLLKMEKEIFPEQFAWQTHYEKWRGEQTFDLKYSWLISVALLLAIPTLISILYYLWVLNNSVFHISFIDPSTLSPLCEMPNILYLSALITYITLSIWVVIIGIRTYREREKNTKKEKKKADD